MVLFAIGHGQHIQAVFKLLFNNPKYVKAVKCQFHESMLFVVCDVCASQPKIGSEWLDHVNRKILLPLKCPWDFSIDLWLSITEIKSKEKHNYKAVTDPLPLTSWLGPSLYSVTMREMN